MSAADVKAVVAVKLIVSSARASLGGVERINMLYQLLSGHVISDF